MVVYPRPPAWRASYCQARRRWVTTASPLGMGPCQVMLTVRLEGNLLLICYFGSGGINLFFGQRKKQMLICFPGDGLPHLCSFGASPYRQCLKCHLGVRHSPKGVKVSGSVFFTLHMKQNWMPKWWCFHGPWKSPSDACLFPTLVI